MASQFHFSNRPLGKKTQAGCENVGGGVGTQYEIFIQKFFFLYNKNERKKSHQIHTSS